MFESLIGQLSIYHYQGSAGFGIAFDVSFLFDIIYISVFFIFMCQCVYFMLLLLYMFRNLKKNEYIMHFLCLPIFADILPIFSPIFPIRYFPDPSRYFPDTDIINTGFFTHFLSQSRGDGLKVEPLTHLSV